MAKLGNLFAGNIIRLTQSPHGTAQGNKALDIVPTNGDLNLYAPCDVEIKATRKDQYNNAYFEAFNNNFKIQYVHAYGVNPGLYKKGAKIGTLQNPKESKNSTGYHVHVAIQVSGTWYPILDFMDRGLKIEQAAGLGWKNWHWQEWGTWVDRQLSIVSLFDVAPLPPNDLERKINELQAQLAKQKADYEKEKMEAILVAKAEKKALEEQIAVLEAEIESFVPIEHPETEPVVDIEDLAKNTDFALTEDKRFDLSNRDNWKKVGRGAAIAAAGAVLTYFGSLLELYDFGESAAIAAWLIPTLINALREFAKKG